MLEDLYFFCQQSKCKEYFYNEAITTDEIQQVERCDLNTRIPKRYFDPNNETTLNLKKHISIFKKEAIELLKKPNCQQSNLTAEKKTQT